MNKEILRLAIPNIISNVSVPLLSTVDTALMGRLSESHLGAVGLGAMIFNFIYWNFGFLRMGTTGMTAQAYGRKASSAVIQILGRAFIVVLGLSIVLILLKGPICDLAIYLLHVQTDQIDLVRDYYNIRILAAPATLGLYALMGWFFGLQNAIIPLVLTVFINIANMLISYYLVRVKGMGVDGVALGTLIAQYAGILLGFLFLVGKYRSYLLKLTAKAVLQTKALQSFLSINLDIFIRTLCLTLAFGFFYSQSSAGGELMLAANVILLQFLNWLSYGVDGFAFASESLVGKYAGQADEGKTRQAIRLSFLWGMAIALGFSLLYGLGGQSLVRIYTDQQDVVHATKPFVFWMILFPVFSTPSYLWDGIFIGLTAAKSMRDTMLMAIIVFILVFWISQPWGNHGLWFTLLVFMVARGGFQYLFFARKGVALD